MNFSTTWSLQRENPNLIHDISSITPILQFCSFFFWKINNKVLKAQPWIDRVESLFSNKVGHAGSKRNLKKTIKQMYVILQL